MNGTIYALTGPDGIRYVGQTRQRLRKRLYQHERCAVSGMETHLYNWWRSLDAPPEIIALETCPVEGLNEREAYWIARLRSDGVALCNQTEGGEGGSPDGATREKLRMANLGKRHGPAAKAKLSAAFKGRTFSEEHRSKLSASQKGRVFSAEHLEKIRIARRRRPPASPETRAKMRESALRHWSDPKNRAKISEGMARARAREEAA